MSDADLAFQRFVAANPIVDADALVASLDVPVDGEPRLGSVAAHRRRPQLRRAWVAAAVFSAVLMAAFVLISVRPGGDVATGESAIEVVDGFFARWNSGDAAAAMALVDLDVDRARWRGTATYRVIPSLQLGLEFNLVVEEVGPLVTWFLTTETDTRPAVFLGTSSDRIGSPEGKQAYFLTVAKRAAWVPVSAYVALNYSEWDERFNVPFGLTGWIGQNFSVQPMFDGDPSDPNYQQYLDYSKTFAFTNFTLERSPLRYEFSSIDMTNKRDAVEMEADYFSLMDFSAKWDPVPTMLTQNHTALVKGFMGQTTSFTRDEIKSNVLIMGENKTNGEAKYIHGIKGKGFFTFYGGHDPEDYTHRVGDPKTELSLHPTSPGYRLILNNVLFPAARKKKQKT